MKMWKSSIGILLLLLVLNLLSPSFGMAENTIDWKSYDEGLALSRQEGKKLFVHFFADW